MSKLPGWITGILLALALMIVIGWPLLATVLEGSQALVRCEGALRSWNLTGAADALAQWRGPAPMSGGSALDPAASEATIQRTGNLGRSLRLALETTRLVITTEAVALPAGVLLALLLVRTDVWGRHLFLGILALSAFVPLPLHATAWLGAFGNMGRAQAVGLSPLLVGHTGAAVVHALAALPWVVFIVGIGLAAVEPELEELALLACGDPSVPSARQR
jgi:iron(III) transport system permease protein